MSAGSRATTVDPLGALLVAGGAAALAFLPFVVRKANRILPGDAQALADVLPSIGVVAFHGTLLLVAGIALFVGQARVRLAAALAGIVMVAWAIAVAGRELTPIGNLVVRVAPGAGFWLLMVCIGLLATDALTRLRPGPGLRVLWLGLFLGGSLLAFAAGAFDELSIMREYAVNSGRFAREAAQHALLTLGSLVAAVLVGLPLGVLCHRAPRLRAATLVALNMIQTIPSIAMFGVLMIPIGALAAAWPWLADLGVRGIGTAPAVTALFLYSLLPVVANTVVGLSRVSPAAVDAALGMGLTSRQRLTSVELPLALPVIITGIRVVLVQNIGLATVAALIGAGGFGAFVFQGIGQTAIDLVLLGAIPVVVLAFSASVVLDALVDVMNRGRA